LCAFCKGGDQGRSMCLPPTRRNLGTLANPHSCSGKHCTISKPNFLTLLPAIQQYSFIAYRQMHPRHANSFSLKIFAINPYSSKILMLSTLQLHCFHRPEGEGVDPLKFANDQR